MCVLGTTFLVSDLAQGRRQWEALGKTRTSQVKPSWRKGCEFAVVPEPSAGRGCGRADRGVERPRRERTAAHLVANHRSTRVAGLCGMSWGVLDAAGGVQGLPWMLVGPRFLAWRAEVGSHGWASPRKSASAVMAAPALGLSSVTRSPVTSAGSPWEGGALGLLSGGLSPQR